MSLNKKYPINPYQSVMYRSPGMQAQPYTQMPQYQMPQTQMPENQMPEMTEMPEMMTPEMQNPPMMQNPMMQMPENESNMNQYSMQMPGDPPPLLSNNPVMFNAVLHKELTAYPNYGNPSRNADILYTGNRGTWSFNSPAFLVPGNMRGRLIIRAVLDDHDSVATSRYSARITVNGTVVHTGRVPLEHGTPTGGMFNNWRELTFNISLRGQNRIVIENTSTAGPNDWIGFDWMEVRLTQR